MASDLIRTAYRSAWWALVLRGVLAIAIGVFIFWRPLASIGAFALVIALWALFGGIVQIVHAFGLRPIFAQWWVLFLSGFVSAAFGVAALYYYPGLSLVFAVVWVTWWFFLTGGFAIYVAVLERSLGLSWGWTLAFGILSVVAGVLAIATPPATLAAIMVLIASFALASGVLLLIGAFKLSSVKTELTDALRGAKLP
jgi:uncharacterized membrane protein HdeD (DUF308 family)